MEDPSLPTGVVEIINRENCTVHKAWRLYRGISAIDMAKRLGMFPHRFQQWEETNNPCYRFLNDAAFIYQCRVEELTD